MVLRKVCEADLWVCDPVIPICHALACFLILFLLRLLRSLSMWPRCNALVNGMQGL